MAEQEKDVLVFMTKFDFEMCLCPTTSLADKPTLKIQVGKTCFTFL